MKTAEDWMDQLSVTPETALISASVNQMVIREIQLDAVKEGMRRAAKITGQHNVDVPVGELTFHELGDDFASDILAASENLTEKDL